MAPVYPHILRILDVSVVAEFASLMFETLNREPPRSERLRAAVLAMMHQTVNSQVRTRSRLDSQLISDPDPDAESVLEALVTNRNEISCWMKI